MARNVMLNTKKRSPNLVTIFFYVMDSFHIQSRKIYDNIFINMLDVYCNLFYFISFGTWCWTWKMDWSSIWGGGATSFLRNEFVFYVASDAIIIFYVCLPIHHIQSNLQNIMPPIATLLKLCIRNAYLSIEVHAQALGENLSIPTHPWQLMTRKCINKSFWLQAEGFWLPILRNYTSKNLRLRTKMICSCVFSSWVTTTGW